MSKEFRYLVRVHGATLDGAKVVPYAIRGIKGISTRLAEAIVKSANIDRNQRLGNMSDADLKRLEDVIENPISHGIPEWMLNRRMDPQSGENLHLTGSDLSLRLMEDINLMKEMRSWKGERHARGLKVRGQHTKTTARKGRSIGVTKKQEQRPQQEK